MNAKSIYTVLGALLGFGLIIGGFLVLGEQLETDVKVLDIVVLCLYYVQLLQLTIIPWIQLGRPAHKEVGMMGIHFYALRLCTLAAVAMVVTGIIYDIPFRYQLTVQLVILLIGFWARVATLHAGENVERIHRKESGLLAKKRDLSVHFADLKEVVDSTRNLDPELVQRFHELDESIRFVTPSDHEEARHIDEQIVQSIEALKLMLRRTECKGEKLVEEGAYLERLLARRKKY